MIEGGIAWLDLFTQINFFRPRLSPFTPWAYVLLAVFNIFKTTTILRSSRANLSGPYLPMYGPHLWLFLFVAFPVKNCQWWHLSNVTKVNRQSRSSERDKKFNYKTPRGNKRVLASSCVLYFNNVQGISRLTLLKVARAIIPSNFPIELWLEFLLWDSLGPLRGSQRVQKGSQRVPGGPREFGEDPSRPKIEKKMHFVFFNF